MKITPDNLIAVLPWVALALILGGVLYYILGRNAAAPQGVQAGAQPVPDLTPPPLPVGREGGMSAQTEFLPPEPDSQAGMALQDLERVQSSFTVGGFFKGVDASFRAVVEAFAKGDNAVLERWLAPSIAQSFAQAIEERNEQGDKAHCVLLNIDKIDLRDVTRIESEDQAPVWQIEAGIYSWQVSYLSNAQGEVVVGSEGRTYFQDKWVFAAQETPAGTPMVWKIVSTHVL